MPAQTSNTGKTHLSETIKQGCVDCEGDKMMAQLLDLMIEARTSPDAKNKLKMVGCMLKSAVAVGTFCLSVIK